MYLRNIPIKDFVRPGHEKVLPSGTVRIDEFANEPGVYYAYTQNGEHIKLLESYKPKRV